MLVHNYETQFGPFLLNFQWEQVILELLTQFGLKYGAENLLYENQGPLS